MAVAICLGLAVVCSAWAGHQGGLWSGNCLTAYSEAGRETTEAASDYNNAVALAIRDSSIDILAKRQVAEAWASEEMLKDRLGVDIASITDGTPPPQAPSETTEPVAADQYAVAGALAKATIAKYLYTQQISPAAYKSLKLDGAYDSEEEEKWIKMPWKDLQGTLDRNLDAAYMDGVLAEPEARFEAAEKKFEAGRNANSTGDAYNFIVVLFTVAMFFEGMALVIKSKVRLGLLGTGVFVSLYALVLMLALPAAGDVSQPADNPAASATSSS